MVTASPLYVFLILLFAIVHCGLSFVFCEAMTVEISPLSSSRSYTLDGAVLDELLIVIKDDVSGVFVSLTQTTVLKFTLSVEGGHLENSTISFRQCNLTTTSNLIAASTSSALPSWSNVSVSLYDTAVVVLVGVSRSSGASVLHLGNAGCAFTSLQVFMYNVSVAMTRSASLTFSGNITSCVSDLNIAETSESLYRATYMSPGGALIYGPLAAFAAVNVTLLNVSFQQLEWDVQWVNASADEAPRSSSGVALVLGTVPMDINGALLLAGKLTSSTVTVRNVHVQVTDLAAYVTSSNECDINSTSSWSYSNQSIVAPSILVQALNATKIMLTNITVVIKSATVPMASESITAVTTSSSSLLPTPALSNVTNTFVYVPTSRTLLLISGSVVIANTSAAGGGVVDDIIARVSTLYPDTNVTYLTFEADNVSMNAEDAISTNFMGALLWLVQSSLDNSVVSAKALQCHLPPTGGVLSRIGRVDVKYGMNATAAAGDVWSVPVGEVASICTTPMTFQEQHQANVELGLRSIVSQATSSINDASSTVGFLIDLHDCSTLRRVTITLEDALISWSSMGNRSPLVNATPSSALGIDHGIAPLLVLRMQSALTVQNVKFVVSGLVFSSPFTDDLKFINHRNASNTCFDANGGAPSLVVIHNGALENVVLSFDSCETVASNASMALLSSSSVALMAIVRNATVRGSNMTFSNFRGGAAGVYVSLSQFVDSYLNVVSLSTSQHRWLGSLLDLGAATDAVGWTMSFQHIELHSNGNMQLVHMADVTGVTLCPLTLADVNVTITTASVVPLDILEAYSSPRFPSRVAFPTAIQVTNITGAVTALDITFAGVSFVAQDFQPSIALEATEASSSIAAVVRGVIEFKNISVFQIMMTTANSPSRSIMSLMNITLVVHGPGGSGYFIGGVVCYDVDVMDTLSLGLGTASVMTEFTLSNISAVAEVSASSPSLGDHPALLLHIAHVALKNVTMGNDSPGDCEITSSDVVWDATNAFGGPLAYLSAAAYVQQSTALILDALLLDTLSTSASVRVNAKVFRVAAPSTFLSASAVVQETSSMWWLRIVDSIIGTDLMTSASTLSLTSTSSSSATVVGVVSLAASSFGGTVSSTWATVNLDNFSSVPALFQFAQQSSLKSVLVTVTATLLLARWSPQLSNTTHAIVHASNSSSSGAVRVDIQRIQFLNTNQTNLQNSTQPLYLYGLLWDTTSTGSAVSIDVGEIDNVQDIVPGSAAGALPFIVAFQDALLPSTSASTTSLRVNISNAAGIVPHVSLIGLQHQASSQNIDLLVVLRNITACSILKGLCTPTLVQSSLVDLRSTVGASTPAPIRILRVTVYGLTLYQGGATPYSSSSVALFSFSSDAAIVTSTSGRIGLVLNASVFQVQNPLVSIADAAIEAAVINASNLSVTSTQLPFCRFAVVPGVSTLSVLRTSIVALYNDTSLRAQVAVHSFIEVTSPTIRNASIYLGLTTFSTTGVASPTHPNAPYVFNMTASPSDSVFTLDAVNVSAGVRNIFNPLVLLAPNRVDVACSRIGMNQWVSDTQLRYQKLAARYYAQSFEDPTLRCPLNQDTGTHSLPTPTSSQAMTESKTRVSNTFSRTTVTMPPIPTDSSELSATRSWTMTPPPTPTPTTSSTDQVTQSNTSVITVTYITPPKTFTRTSSTTLSTSVVVSMSRASPTATGFLSATKGTSSSSHSQSISATQSISSALSLSSTLSSNASTLTTSVSNTATASTSASSSIGSQTSEQSSSWTTTTTFNRTISIDGTVTHVLSPTKSASAPTVDISASKSHSISSTVHDATFTGRPTTSNETSRSSTLEATATPGTDSASHSQSHSATKSRHTLSLSQTCAQPSVTVGPESLIYVYDMMKHGLYINLTTSQPLNVHRFPSTRTADVGTFVTLSWGRVRFAVVLEAFLMSLILDTAEFVSLDTTYNIDIRLNGGLFECPVNSALEPVVAVTAKSKPPALGVTVTTATTSAVAGAALPATVVAGAAGAGSMQRASLQLSLAVCEFSLSEPLDAATSPTQLGFGPPQCYYIRGAVVGNLILMVTICLISVLAVALRIFFGPRPRMEWIRAAGSLALPGWLILPISALLQPVSMSSITLLRNPAPDGPYASADMFIGLMGLLWCVASWAVVMYLMTTGFHALAVPHCDTKEEQEKAVEKARRVYLLIGGAASGSDEDVKSEKEDDDDSSKAGKDDVDGPTKTPGLRDVIEKVSHKTYEWVDTHHGRRFVKRYGPIFDVYSTGRNWFVLVELAMSLLSGVAGGLTPNYEDLCDEIQIVLAVLCGLYLLAVALLWPYNSRILTVVQILNAALAFVWSVVIFFSSVPDIVADALSAAQVWLMVLCVAAAFLDILLSQRVQRILGKLASMATKKKDSAEAEISDSKGLLRTRSDVTNVNDFNEDLKHLTTVAINDDPSTDSGEPSTTTRRDDVNSVLWLGEDDDVVTKGAHAPWQKSARPRRDSIASIQSQRQLESEVRFKRQTNQEQADRLLSHKLHHLMNRSLIEESRQRRLGGSVSISHEEETFRLTSIVECVQLANRIREL